MAWYTALVGLTILASHATQAFDIQQTETDLRQQLSSGAQFTVPGDSQWSQDIVRWTEYEAPDFVLSVKPAVDSDVQKVVQYASSHDIPFLATGGRHGFTTSLGGLQQGLDLDLSAFKNVSVDAKAKTLTVGGATLFADIYNLLYEAGLEVQTGSCSCVNMVGATLGGGVSPLQGLQGLIIDALLSVRMVTGTGAIVTASATQNPELFWGMRGAGFNYGVVLSATYRAYDLPHNGQFVNADFVFPANASTNHWQLLQRFAGKQPAGLSLVTTITYQEQYGGTNIVFNAQYAGPLDEAKSLLQPFIANHPVSQNISVLPWNEVTASASFSSDAMLCEKGKRLSLYTAGLKTIDVSTWQTVFSRLDQLYRRYPQVRDSALLAETFPVQAVQAVAQNATSYPHRDVTTQLLFRYANNDTSLDDVVKHFATDIRSLFAKTSGFDSLKAYVSYGHGDEGTNSWYGANNLKALTALKESWDPRNLFRFNNPIKS